MQSKLVKESLFEFQKGLDPIDSLGMGRRKLIKDWLDKMGVENYTINDDYTIDVDGYVELRSKNLKEFPEFIQFGNVRYFICTDNDLISLRGCPKNVTNFWCDSNELMTLEGAPKFAKGYFSCRYNPGKFTEADVLKVCNVKGPIWVN